MKHSVSREQVLEQPPLRAELFSTEQLELFAEKLAETHHTVNRPKGDLLLKQLSANEEILRSTHLNLQEVSARNKEISGSGVWLLDNFYLIDEQIQIAKRYLPRNFSASLPKLAEGKYKGLPRVYQLAVELITHTDSYLNINGVTSFINSYQKKSLLSIGELWALPIMLRLALIENLKRLASAITLDLADADLAEYWADRMIRKTEENPRDLVLVLAELSTSEPPLYGGFISELNRRLQWKSRNLELALNWIEQCVAETGQTVNSVIFHANQKKAADQVSMSNCITSLRLIAKIDWRTFVEAVCVVDKVLSNDPEGAYFQMDFDTRNRYRSVVEDIARHSGFSEEAVARMAVELSQMHNNAKPRHVGYFLIDVGVKELRRKARAEYGVFASFRGFFKENTGAFYFPLIFLLTVLIWGALVFQVAKGVSQIWVLLGLSLVALLVASQPAITLVNWLMSLWKRPEALPRLDFSKRIPDHCRTLIAVPTMLANEEQVAEMLESLEIRYLSNNDKNLVFALVTDFLDSKVEIAERDTALLEQAAEGIRTLNVRYRYQGDEKFFLFHRPRKWNEAEGVWMGYERKRGKLADLNKLLRGDERAFSCIVGKQAAYSGIKYVITLDSDTQIPRESAWKLVGIMAHPLNKPFLNQAQSRVEDGYGIIQPRISISLNLTNRTYFSRLHENDAGIDPYTRVTSDLYQDVFRQGSFIGKGIYDVDVFEEVLSERFPENRILSHDLLEGSYVRCGYASDVQLYEEYPSSYENDMGRRHRWVRGDWQISAWVLPFVPDLRFKLKFNPVNLLSRWKIFDNLRRSLVPLAFTFLLIYSWFFFPKALMLTILLGCVYFLPPMLFSVWGMLQLPEDITLNKHARNSVRSIAKSFVMTSFSLITLPYEAYVNVHAILTSLYRLLISRKKLLEWNPFGLSSLKSKNLQQAYFKMWAAPLIGLSAIVWLSITNWQHLLLAAPLLMAWLLSPFVAFVLNMPLIKPRSAELSEQQKKDLRVLARKTWAYFENLVGPEDNWLPPDNLQLEPKMEVAHRTSPTNIGLMFLSNLSAVDFGFNTAAALIEQTKLSFASLSKLERLNGHFYNWYDTRTLEPLRPRYISTVDSGNLGGHLLTFRQGLLELREKPLLGPEHAEGLLDTLKIILKLMPMSRDENKRFYLESKEILRMEVFKTRDFYFKLIDFRTKLNLATEQLGIQRSCDLLIWIERMDVQLSRLFKEIATFSPWLELNIPGPVREIAQNLEDLTLEELADAELHIDAATDTLRTLTDAEMDAFLLLKDQAHAVAGAARKRIQEIHKLSSKAWSFAEMAYDFLYDKEARMLCLGYNVDEHRLEKSHYDLLASEARLAIFLAIAQGKIPQESWFALGRRLTTVNNEPVLLSWSGSMFEYLMPTLVMPSYQNTLLNSTEKGCVQKQIEYGQERNIPWGISESCYNILDANFIYQYKAFGVPNLAFKKGLAQEQVVAPYATVMSLMTHPKEAWQNIVNMKQLGFEGVYGFYEAVDYTPSRLPKDKNSVIIKTFMVHHQGMSLLSLAYLLQDQPMQKRFEKDPQLFTALLLLQERVPRTTSVYIGSPEVEKKEELGARSALYIFQTPHTENPEVQLLSNGSLHTMVTNAGGGYSHWKGLSLNRWREDGTQDHHGFFCYIRNLNTGDFWSNTYQPTLKEPDYYTADFSHGKIDFHRRDKGIETHTEIIVSPEDDVEIRRITLHNHNSESVLIEVTSYCEVVIADPASDNHHSAFSNLFVQTEIDESQKAIFCTRRPRSQDGIQPWMFQSVRIANGPIKQTSYETSRMNFIGRGNTLLHPQALKSFDKLGGTQGSVLDPIAATRKVFLINPRKKVSVDIITGIAYNKEDILKQLNKYNEKHFRDRAFDLSWTHNQVVLHQIGADMDEAEVYSKLAGPILYANKAFRASEHILSQNTRGQSALWSYSISGDLPIILLLISTLENLKLAKQLVQAMTLLESKGINADLVILNEDFSSYRQDLNEQIQGLVAAKAPRKGSGRRGSVFVRQADQMPSEDRILLQSVARIIISDKLGSLEEQLSRVLSPTNNVKKLKPSSDFDYPSLNLQMPKDLQFFNGSGGFSADGKEYVILTGPHQHTPLPWVNVIANPHLGMVISERGASYTFAENAHGFRLTPWNNDPVMDPPGEAYYIRDEETGRYWSPMPLPATGKRTYITRHGFGYSVFEHEEQGIASEVTVYVDQHHAIKFVKVRIKNIYGKARKLTLTGYVEWVLGSQRTDSLMHTITDVDEETGAFIARNNFNTEFPGRVAFLDTDAAIKSFTCNRKEFIGRNGNLSEPKAMDLEYFSNSKGAGLDPCTALQVYLELDKQEEREVVFRLGSGRDKEEALFIIRMFKGAKAAHQSLEETKTFWHATLSSTQINTPDPTLNLLANGWLLYQTISSRLWGKSGFYQSGGAFGYRDQLQDVLALLHSGPQLVRSHILLAASRQFKEGDVQHWWHPPMGRGVRTMCSDDFLWLAYVTWKYLESTQDYGILDEQANFLEGRLLNEGEESYFDMPVISYLRASLYEHCKLSIRRGLRFGERGLPLMGSGDWNDGMSLVGIEGKGESVWLAFFLYKVLSRFEGIARIKDDYIFAEECSEQAARLKENIHRNGWDGYWYLRAYFDDGTPLGSSHNDECSIDSIAQSWSVLSGGGEEKRSEMALNQAYRQLVDKEKGLIKLLHPPFRNSEPDPGYIRSYVPGVRENGGQYTHAAIWLIMAFAKTGNKERVWELLQLINPIKHATTAQEVNVYKVEPYVVAADVYGIEPHTGRGGWTWYTGSAAWMYQLILEQFLGLNKQGSRLSFKPVVPEEWQGFEMTYTYMATRYKLTFSHEPGLKQVKINVDGEDREEDFVQLVNDGVNHEVMIRYS
jgi:cellobiose phosphorylase